jgi:hypothetical protein
MSEKKQILLLFILSFFYSVAQDNSKELKTWSNNDVSTLMKEQINRLKNGQLLVRLQSKQNAVEALLKAGQKAKAEKYKSEQGIYNMRIIKAFRQYYTFSPVYFFFSDYTDKIQSKNFDKVVFVDDSLHPDSTIKIKSDKFLTAEFGILSQDTAKYFSNYYYENSKNGPQKKAEYNGSTDMRFEVLKIMSDQFVQLMKPFPYYVKSTGSFNKPEKIIEAIKKMNTKLLNFNNQE